MSMQQDVEKKSSHKGLFLIFTMGLFFLQIAFAFTIHGDIGPQTQINPGVEPIAAPVLIGRIDSLITPPAVRQPVKPLPEGVLAPATPPQPVAVIQKKAERPSTRSLPKKPLLDDKGGRYFEYTIARGDTLQSISKSLFGSSRMIPAIVRLNRIKDERNLKCGTRLLIPRLNLANANLSN